MLFNLDRFKKDISQLKGLKKSSLLNPLRKEQIKQNLLAAIDAQTETVFHTERTIVQERKKVNMLRYITGSLLGLSLITGTAFASQSAKPGDVLFPIKKTQEKMRVALTTDDQAKADLSSNIAQQRIDDIEKEDSDNKPVAEQEATNEVDNAISTLTDVKAKLEAKGNLNAAAHIQENIDRLKARAHEKSLHIEGDANENENEQKGNDQNGQGDQNDQGDRGDKQDQKDNVNEQNVNLPSVNVQGKADLHEREDANDQNDSGDTNENEQTQGSANVQIHSQSQQQEKANLNGADTDQETND